MATITVSGYGEVSVPPDEATLTFGFRVRGRHAARRVEAKEESGFHPMPREAGFAPMIAEAVPIESGEMTIACNLSVTFQVEPA